jgi:hypothetical protein
LAASVCGDDQQGTPEKTNAKATIPQKINLFLLIAVVSFQSFSINRTRLAD